MTGKIVGTALLAAFLLTGTPALAAGFGAPQYACRVSEEAYELLEYTSISMLRDEVHTRFEHAAEVSRSEQAIRSKSPLFVWANEAKASCAKAYGYLRKPRKWRKRPDYVMLQKCDCFYQRMTWYLGR